MQSARCSVRLRVERVDGAQARLKLSGMTDSLGRHYSGKGGWGSGEIETAVTFDEYPDDWDVERVDGAQARLKLHDALIDRLTQPSGKGGWGSGEIETALFAVTLMRHVCVERVDGAQARLKQVRA